MIAMTPWHFEDQSKALGHPEYAAHCDHLILLLHDSSGSQYGDGYHV